MEEFVINQEHYKVVTLLGKGKGGYSYLVSSSAGEKFVAKKIHHEPCEYYNFGNKIEAEIHDYSTLLGAEIPIPKLIFTDKEQEIILKEYIEGPTVADVVASHPLDNVLLEQIISIASLAKSKGINIDYFPTNFILRDSLLWYIDYECNSYMEKWDFPTWGLSYWFPKEHLDYHIKNLTNKSAVSACASSEVLCTVSSVSPIALPYLGNFFELLSDKSSYVRNRALSLISANAKWDKEEIGLKLEKLTALLKDPKPITVRICLTALKKIKQSRPNLANALNDAVEKADFSVYQDSMRPLLERDRTSYFCP